MLSDLACAGRAAAAAWCVAARCPEDALAQAQAHWTHGTAILHVPSYAAALEQYDLALAWYERACQALAPQKPERDVRVVQVVRVFCLSELGRYDEALEAVAAGERWLQEQRNDAVRLTLLLNRSQLAGTMGNYPQMLALADATVELATQLDYPDRVAEGWVNRANACIYLGHFDAADAAITHAIESARIAEEPITIARAQCCRAWLLHCQGQLFDALAMLREAQRGFAQAAGEAATILLEEAAIYEQLRQLPEAQQAARAAAALYGQLQMPLYSAQAALQATRLALQQGKAAAARKLLNLATEQARSVQLPILDAQIALVQAQLVALPLVETRPRARRAAHASAHQATAALEAHGLAQEVARGWLVTAELDTLLGQTAAAITTYHDLTRHSSPQIRLAAWGALGALMPPEIGLPYLQEAAALAVEQRRMLPMEELQARYSAESSPHHMRLAACCLALGHVGAAFEAVCAAKAGPLLDLRAAASSGDATISAILSRPKADIARWRKQAEEHAYAAQRALQAGQRQAAEYHTRCASEATAACTAGEQALTQALRTLGGRHGQAPVPAHEATQAALLTGTALLEYAELGDELVCFLVRPDQPLRYRRLGELQALPALLDRWSLMCRRLMEHTPPGDVHDQIKAALAPLQAMVIDPWIDSLQGISHLVVAPCGILYHVPWAALELAGAYLNDALTLTLTPCGAMRAAPPAPPQQAAGPARLLGYAGSGRGHLQHVEAELAAIARHIPTAHVKLNATTADLRAAPPPALLHIASHGLTNPAAPLCSSLELADGPFLLLEAHRLDLRGTRLVVLSACETSVRPDHGDMALALAGAFLCAGAGAVVASLWRVADAAAATLMEQCYAAMAAGVPPAAALQQARTGARTRHPLDWAAFQLWEG